MKWKNTTIYNKHTKNNNNHNDDDDDDCDHTCTYTDELKQWKDKVLDMSSSQSLNEKQLLESSSLQLQLSYQIKKLEQEMEVAQNHNKWLNDQLTTKSQEYQSLKSTHQQQLQSMQAQLTESLDSVESLREQVRQLKSVNTRQEKELESRLSSLNEQSQRLTLVENESRSQLNAREQLPESYKQKCDNLEMRLLDSDRLRDEMRRQLIGEKQTIVDKYEVCKKQLLEAREELKAAQQQIGRLTSSIDTMPQRASHLINVGLSGDSATDYCSKYMRCEEELLQSRNEVKRLNDTLNSIMRQLEEKAPIIMEQR